MEEFAKCSLPSISSLLGIADNTPSQQREQTRPMSQHTADDQKNPVQYTSSSAATTPRQSLPLTPPTYPDLREGVPNAESRRVSMPLTQPQYGLPNLYVMAPAPQNMNNYYPTIVGNPHISDGVNHQQPLLNVGLPLLDARYASLLIMFGQHSSDFSYSKGVKGNPVRFCAKTEARDIRTHHQVPCSTEVAYCKVQLFRQVLQNMVSNAIKFTEQGSIRIITKVSAEDETSYTLLAEVVDTGIGVPLHAIGPLFTPFAQFDSTRMRSIILTSITVSQIGFVCAGIIFTAENMDAVVDERARGCSQGEVETLQQMRGMERATCGVV
ncbi:hypothetical protein V502_00440 [Pseudogymnoascus sp. VKM F-4520 (FW-2644)]|nr:hypothetical protein V502_00440 [Pseudogymnoascus sp. VKM F-4520 (FW-2644)]